MKLWPFLRMDRTALVMLPEASTRHIVPFSPFRNHTCAYEHPPSHQPGQVNPSQRRKARPNKAPGRRDSLTSSKTRSCRRDHHARRTPTAQHDGETSSLLFNNLHHYSTTTMHAMNDLERMHTIFDAVRFNTSCSPLLRLVGGVSGCF